MVRRCAITSLRSEIILHSNWYQDLDDLELTPRVTHTMSDQRLPGMIEAYAKLAVARSDEHETL
jgi:predicted GNAT family N-acyltransferase